MKIYLQLLQDVLLSGQKRTDRTGVGTRSVFGRQLRFNLSDSFPLLTSKRIAFQAVVHELLWFLSGSTNTDYLHQHHVHIWDDWADEQGNLGPIYGSQWRSWPDENGQPIDQIRQLLIEIQKNPHSRRLIVSSWNVGQLKKMSLPPCHCLFQFYVADGRLSCHLYQRSGDIFIGVPFNIASYSLLTLMVAQISNLQPGEFIHSFGDLHLYLNHVEQAKLQLQRTPKPAPTVQLNPEIRNLFKFQATDIELLNYDPHPAIKADVAV